MPGRVLDQQLLGDRSFWKGKQAILPAYNRQELPVRSLCFSAGRMAYAHTGDILQDLLNLDSSTGLMVGVESYARGYFADLAAADFLLTQLIVGERKGEVIAKIQGAIRTVLFVESSRNSISCKKLMEYARDPRLQFATINAPEGAYCAAYTGGEFAEPINSMLKDDMANGTITTDPAKWTAFALERFKAGLKFALVSCTNFSGNGYYTQATLKTVAHAWERGGFAPSGFTAYLSDPAKFAFPNTMIDRIAVPADSHARQALQELGIDSAVAVTEKARYWAIEDCFPAGRPAFERAEGVFVESSYDEVKKYEDMKLRILNMSHSVIAGLGVLLGYRGAYGIYKAMQDRGIRGLIDSIIRIAVDTVDAPRSMSPAVFARDAIQRLENPNVPDDPMRIALNASTKMKPRFIDTYIAAQKRGIPDEKLEAVLVPVAGFLRYTLGIDDQGQQFALQDDPLKEKLVSCGARVKLGEPATAPAFAELISCPEVMGENLYQRGGAGRRLEGLAARMVAGSGAVREVIASYAIA